MVIVLVQWMVGCSIGWGMVCGVRDVVFKCKWKCELESFIFDIWWYKSL